MSFSVSHIKHETVALNISDSTLEIKVTMTTLLPQIGVTSCAKAITLLRAYPANTVGAFWSMSGYDFDDQPLPDWWTDAGAASNFAETLLEFCKNYLPRHLENHPLYLGFCILVVAERGNPANLSFVVQHVKLIRGAGLSLLRILAQHNIPVHTEVASPMAFLSQR